MVCDTCGIDKDVSKFNVESFSPDTCFSCRVRGVSFANPIKSAQGEDQWRHSTIAEFGRNQVAEAAENGLEAVPKHTAGGYAPSGKQLDKIKGALSK